MASDPDPDPEEQGGSRLWRGMRALIFGEDFDASLRDRLEDAAVAHPLTINAAAGTGRKWSVSERPLCSTSTPAGRAALASTATASITARQVAASGCSTVWPPSVHSSP